MPERKSHAPGSFCWPEIAADDPQRAKEFYSDLFEWDMHENPSGFYIVARLRGRPVAGLYGLSDAQRKGHVPPHWLSYVRVASADETAKKAQDLGGKVLAPPFDVPEVGRMAALGDPSGAVFAIWEPRGMEGAGLVDEPGAPCWYELMTPDAARARAFYSDLFGWTPHPMPMAAPPGEGGPPMEYTIFHNGSDAACGMMEVGGPAMEGIPPHWMPYIAVEDCDVAASLCASLGGRVCATPMDIPNVGRFSVLTAPDGAAFAVIRLLPPAK